MRLRVDPAALQEILDAEEFAEAEFGVTVVNEFRTAVANSLEEITRAPYRYPQKKRNIRSKVLLPYPYSIIYERVDDTVRVYAFAHHKRKPGYWRKRASEK